MSTLRTPLKKLTISVFKALGSLAVLTGIGLVAGTSVSGIVGYSIGSDHNKMVSAGKSLSAQAPIAREIRGFFCDEAGSPRIEHVSYSWQKNEGQREGTDTLFYTSVLRGLGVFHLPPENRGFKLRFPSFFDLRSGAAAEVAPVCQLAASGSAQEAFNRTMQLGQPTARLPLSAGQAITLTRAADDEQSGGTAHYDATIPSAEFTERYMPALREATKAASTWQGAAIINDEKKQSGWFRVLHEDKTGYRLFWTSGSDGTALVRVYPE